MLLLHGKCGTPIWRIVTVVMQAVTWVKRLYTVKHVTGKERDGLDLNDLADFQFNEQILEQIKEKYSTHPGKKGI